MLDPANDLLPPPSSPTNSSISSSDLDTESTGSFFHDRSTTLGTLMGVSFPAIAFRAPSQRRRETPTYSSSGGGGAGTAVNPSGGGSRRCRRGKSLAAAAERRRRWWSLCRGDADARPSSLGEFLAVERRFGGGEGGDFFGTAAELEAAAAEGGRERRGGGGRVLFADGRVLPPAVDVDETASSSAGVLCRFPVLLTGICSGCVG